MITVHAGDSGSCLFLRHFSKFLCGLRRGECHGVQYRRDQRAFYGVLARATRVSGPQDLDPVVSRGRLLTGRALSLQLHLFPSVNNRTVDFVIQASVYNQKLSIGMHSALKPFQSSVHFRRQFPL